jgi:hypothetical protein
VSLPNTDSYGNVNTDCYRNSNGNDNSNRDCHRNSDAYA